MYSDRITFKNRKGEREGGGEERTDFAEMTSTENTDQTKGVDLRSFGKSSGKEGMNDRIESFLTSIPRAEVLLWPMEEKKEEQSSSLSCCWSSMLVERLSRRSVVEEEEDWLEELEWVQQSEMFDEAKMVSGRQVVEDLSNSQSEMSEQSEKIVVEKETNLNGVQRGRRRRRSGFDRSNVVMRSWRRILQRKRSPRSERETSMNELRRHRTVNMKDWAERTLDSLWSFLLVSTVMWESRRKWWNFHRSNWAWWPLWWSVDTTRSHRYACETDGVNSFLCVWWTTSSDALISARIWLADWWIWSRGKTDSGGSREERRTNEHRRRELLGVRDERSFRWFHCSDWENLPGEEIEWHTCFDNLSRWCWSPILVLDPTRSCSVDPTLVDCKVCIPFQSFARYQRE